MNLPLLLGFTQALALTMSVAFLTYVGLIVLPYVKHKRAASPAGTHKIFRC